MGRFWSGFVMVALLCGIGVAVAAPDARAMPAATSTPSPSATPAPAALSGTPVLTQQPDGTWTTTLSVNSAALCPTPPSFALVTTDPNASIPEKSPDPHRCATATSGPVPEIAQVSLTFSPPPGALPVPPVNAAVVMTPASGGPPVAVTVAVHRIVTAAQYVWIPVGCGIVLAVLLIGGIFALGLPDPSSPARDNGRPEKVRGARLWRRPLYAGGAWSFGGSWATNITTIATLATSVLAATGAVSELLPGVETGRFSLLIALAGGITLAAPLVFGALNYRFARVDPTSTRAALITLPAGPVAILSRGPRTWLRERLGHEYRYGGTAVTMPAARTSNALPADAGGRQPAADAQPASKRFSVTALTEVMRPDGRTGTVPGGYRARMAPPEQQSCEIAVAAGATITVSGAAHVAPPPPGDNAAASGFKPQPPAFTEVLPAAVLDIYSGATLTVPLGGIVTVSSPESPEPRPPCLSLPGGTDVVVSAGQVVSVYPWVILSGADTNLPPGTPASRASYALPASRSIELAGNAKISAIGTASLMLPVGTRITSSGPGKQGAGGAEQSSPARAVSLTDRTVFPLPHTGEVVASTMWALLLASVLTLFGTGAEIGLLGVLAFGLSTASLLIRSLCVAFLVVAAVVLWAYSMVSVMALADPAPGDALSTGNTSSFLL